MPAAEHVAIPIHDLTLHDPAARPMPLAALTGVQVVVLLRHRH